MSGPRQAPAQPVVVDDVPVRVASALVGVCGAAATAVTGLVPVAVVVGAVVVLGLAAAAAAQQLPRRLRAGLGFGTLLIATGLAVAGGTSPLTTLSLAAVWLLVTAHAVADTLRELAVAAALGLALLLLSAGLTPTPALAAPMLAGWVAAVATLVLAQRVRGLGRPGAVRATTAAPRTSSGRPIAAHVAAAVGVSVLAALVAVLVVPLPDSAPAARRLAGLDGADGGDGTRSPVAGTRSIATYQGDQLDLRVRGDLPSTPVAAVPADSPSHWRVAVLSEYDGTTWSADRAGPLAPTLAAGDGRWFVAAALADGDGAGLSGLRQDRVKLLEPSEALLAPGHPQSVQLTDGAVQSFQGSRLLRLDATSPTTTYDVTSDVVPDAASITGPAAAAPAVLPGGGQWLDLPPTVSERTRALAVRITASATTRGQQVVAVEQYLRSTYPYRLDSPVPPPGQDAVDHFLFDARVGFCEQFAAAEVVLLRSVGIPARLATGYAFGTVVGGTRTFAGKDAHAWVEVWQPGYGWTTSDPTPASTSADRGSEVMAAARRVLSRSGARWAFAGLLVLLGVGVAGAIGLWRRRREARIEPLARGRQSAQEWMVVAALARLRSALREAGRPGPDAETLTELGRRVPELGGRAVTVAERTLYGRRPPTEPVVDEAVRAIDAAAREVLARASGP